MPGDVKYAHLLEGQIHDGIASSGESRPRFVPLTASARADIKHDDAKRSKASK